MRCVEGPTQAKNGVLSVTHTDDIFPMALDGHQSHLLLLKGTSGAINNASVVGDAEGSFDGSRVIFVVGATLGFPFVLSPRPDGAGLVLLLWTADGVELGSVVG